MARFFPEKIAAILLLAVFLSVSADAKEEFVKYSEVRTQLEAKPGQGSLVSADELRALQEKGEQVLLFDARAKTEFDRERIQGARLPRSDGYYRDQQLFQQKIVRQTPASRPDLEKTLQGIPRDALIVTYCNKHCALSKNLKLDMEALGFTNVRWLEGGIDDWRTKGYPLEKNS